MKTLTPIDEHGLFADKNDVVRVDSRYVAIEFGKAHDKVLRDIRALDCSEDFKSENFCPAIYVNRQDKKQPCYHMTITGFLYLVSGYCGKKAARIKEWMVTDPFLLADSILDYEAEHGRMGVDESEAKTGNPTHYKRTTVDGHPCSEHRTVWEAAYGPIPEGAVIHHKDGNKGNNALENLALFPDNEAHVRHHAENIDYYAEQRKRLRTCYDSALSREALEKTDSEMEVLLQDHLDSLSDEFDTPAKTNEFDMINRIAIGMTAKQFRERHGIPDGESIRPYLTEKQISDIGRLQHADIGLTLAVPDFQERKRILTEFKANRLDESKA